MDDWEQQRQEAEALAGAFSGSSPAERERLARIVDLLPCYVALIDEKQRVVFYNKAFERFFGKPDGITPHRSASWLDAAGRVIRSLDARGEDGNVMEWVHQASGNAFRVHAYPFSVDGTSGLSVLEVGFNITASLRMQQALDLSEQSYRAITDNLSIGIALLDPRLRIKAGNIRLGQWFGEGFRLDRRICELLQCGSASARAIRELDFFCPECPIFASYTDGAGHERELSVSLQGGKERILRLVTCPVKPGRTKGGKPRVRAMILMLEDITNRLRVNQQLQRARKLEAMSTLAGGIAHEINQPLSALHLYAGGLQLLLEKQRALPSEVTRERLSLIMSEADKIRSIISHMRSLVMQEEPAPLAGVALGGAVDNAIGIMRHQMQTRGIRVEADIPAGLPLVRSNEVQLEQVLVNLLANAQHALDSAAPSGGKDGQAHAAPRLVLIRARHLPETARVRLEVADSGPGLQEGGEQIFDPFYTTKERHEGMGLGLSIVHGFISLWGGEIGALAHHPELGGASFFIDLRLAENGEQPEFANGSSEEPAAIAAPHTAPHAAPAMAAQDKPAPKRAVVKLRRQSGRQAASGEKDKGGKA